MVDGVGEVISPTRRQWEPYVAVSCSDIVGCSVGKREDEELMVAAVPEEVAHLIESQRRRLPRRDEACRLEPQIGVGQGQRGCDVDE